MEDFEKDVKNLYPLMKIKKGEETFNSQMRTEAMVRTIFLRVAKIEARQRVKGWFGFPITNYRKVYRQMIKESQKQIDDMLAAMKKYPDL